MICPEVSIVIPTYNRVNLLKRSLKSALRQSFSDIEVVVCDDGSGDGTREFLANINDCRLKVVSHSRNVGMFANMNSGLNAATGMHFLMLSDDDWLEAESIRLLMSPWRSVPGLVLSYGQWWYHKAGRAALQASEGPAIENGLDYVRGYFKGKRRTILHGALFRTADVRRVGGIPNGYAQDTLLTLRVALEGCVAYVPSPVSNYQMQASSATHSVDLVTALRDRKACLDMCLNVCKEQGVSTVEISSFASTAKRRLAYEAALGLISCGASGSSKEKIWRLYGRLREYLAARPLLGLASICAALSIPGCLLSFFRKISRFLKE